MARPKKTDETLLISVLEQYYAEEACGNAGCIRYTELEKYASSQGIPAREYEFRRSSAVRERLEELKKADRKGELRTDLLAYKGLDIEGMIRTCRDLSDLKKKLAEMDAYWKSIYDSCTEMSKNTRSVLAQKADAEKKAVLMKQEADRIKSFSEETEKENRELRRENAYLRRMMERYLYPDLARQLMTEAHLPVKEPKSITKEALNEMIEGKRPLSFEGAQKEMKMPKSRAEQLLEEMRRQAEE